MVSTILKEEISKFEKNWPWYVIGVLLLVVAPHLYWAMDGEYFNRVLSFENGVDPLAMQTTQDAYCPGDDVVLVTAFCKNREVETFQSNWRMVDGQIIPVRSVGPSRDFIPPGCYPEGSETILRYAFTIPEGTHPGLFHAVGTTVHTLTGDRQREQYYKTTPFLVKTEQECNLE